MTMLVYEVSICKADKFLVTVEGFEPLPGFAINKQIGINLN